jgi:hypothetical protein
MNDPYVYFVCVCFFCDLGGGANFINFFSYKQCLRRKPVAHIKIMLYLKLILFKANVMHGDENVCSHVKEHK